MSTAPTPAPVDPYAAAIQRLTTVVIGAVVAAIFAVVVVGFLVWHASRPAPSPVDPLPADVRAFWLSTADAWDAAAADLDAGKINEDAAQVTNAVAAHRKAANDKLFSDFPAGHWSVRLHDAAKVARSIAGKK